MLEVLAIVALVIVAAPTVAFGALLWYVHISDFVRCIQSDLKK